MHEAAGELFTNSYRLSRGQTLPSCHFKGLVGVWLGGLLQSNGSWGIHRKDRVLPQPASDGFKLLFLDEAEGSIHPSGSAQLVVKCSQLWVKPRTVYKEGRRVLISKQKG